MVQWLYFKNLAHRNFIDAGAFNHIEHNRPVKLLNELIYFY